MFKPLPMLRSDLSLIKDDAPGAALLLANFTNFAPETSETIPEELPELPGEDYRHSYSENKSRLDKIVGHYGIAVPEAAGEAMQPVGLEQLNELGAWLKQVWQQCSEDQERMRQLHEDRLHAGNLLRALDQFRDINIDLTRLQEKGQLLNVHVGTLPLANIKRFEEALHLAGSVAIRFFTTAELIHLIIAGATGQSGDIERVLQAAGWHSTDIPAEFHGHPDEVRKELTARMAQLDEQSAREEQQRNAQVAEADFHARLINAAQTLMRAAPYAELAAMMRGRGQLVTVSGWIPGHQLPRLRADHAFHLIVHELLMPAIQHLARVARQRVQLEVEELVDIQRAGLVLIVEMLVLRLVKFTVDHAQANQELRPFEIAVAIQQRVVQVKQGQLQFFCPITSFKSGTVGWRFSRRHCASSASSTASSDGRSRRPWRSR